MRRIRNVKVAFGSDGKVEGIGVDDTRSDSSQRHCGSPAGRRRGLRPGMLSRPSFGIPPADFDKIIEHPPTRKVFAGETLDWSEFG
jgi:hypothetical protein